MQSGISWEVTSIKLTGPVAMAGKTAGGFVFALIFFATFFYQEKKVERELNESCNLEVH